MTPIHARNQECEGLIQENRLFCKTLWISQTDEIPAFSLDWESFNSSQAGERKAGVFWHGI
jgi:hypothetical protein